MALFERQFQIADRPASSVARPREGALDLLKLALAFMVVGLHGNVLREAGNIVGVPVQAMLRLAVPTFFLISGLFLERMSPAQVTIWVWRLVALYLGWSVVYAVPWLVSGPRDPVQVATTLVFGHHHLWFLTALIGAGLILHRLRNLGSRALLALAALSFGLGVGLQYAGNYHLFANAAIDDLINQFWVYRNFLFFGFPFLTLGFLISRHSDALRWPRPTFILAMLSGLALLLAERAANFWLTQGRETFDLMIALPFVAVPLLLWVRSFEVSFDTRAIASIATTVYLIHVLILDWMTARAGLTETPTVILTAAISFLAGYLFVRLRRAVPVGPRFVVRLFGSAPLPMTVRRRRGS
jgi:surface polysaccharide O-acyltransferase-like enzyme